MSYSIKGDPDHIRRQADNLSDLAVQIERELLRLDNTLNPLRSTFIGQRAGNFFQQYDQLRGQMFALRDVVRAFSGQLTDAANRLKAADRS